GLVQSGGAAEQEQPGRLAQQAMGKQADEVALLPAVTFEEPGLPCPCALPAPKLADAGCLLGARKKHNGRQRGLVKDGTNLKLILARPQLPGSRVRHLDGRQLARGE